MEYPSTADTPKRVTHCVTHHHACDCREWEREHIEKERDALREKVARLAAALRGVEYYYDCHGESCPWCGWTKSMGHAPDCARQKALEDA